jgi:predicted O-methyltransferase YrrM
MDLAVMYRWSMVLFAASDLDVFTMLAEGPRTASEIAAACGVHERPLEIVLNACAAQQILARDGDRYRNTPVADAYLVRGRQAYIGDGLKYAEDLYPAWGRLLELVRTNRPVVEAEEMLGGDRERTRHFVMGMHNRALGIAAALPYGVDLRGRRRLLDVGGGPGTYSILLAKATPGLRATVMDLPGVLEISREIIAGYGMADRVATLPGDYTTAEFPGGHDVVLLSGMMHRETPETCRLLLRKAFGALDPGGLVVVSDVFFDSAAKDSPAFATHFALNMMLTSRDGSTHARTEMTEWMRQAGFTSLSVKDLPPPNPHSLVMGSRP